MDIYIYICMYMCVFICLYHMDSFTTYSRRCSVNSTVFHPHTQLSGFWCFCIFQFITWTTKSSWSHSSSQVLSCLNILSVDFEQFRKEKLYYKISRYISRNSKNQTNENKTYEKYRKTVLAIFCLLDCFDAFLHLVNVLIDFLTVFCMLSLSPFSFYSLLTYHL